MADSFGKVRSTVEILDTASGSRAPAFAAEGIFEAPNWTLDGTLDPCHLASVCYPRI